MKRLLTVALIVALTAVAGLARPDPASATIHEIVASFCSGKGATAEPPGQSDPTKNSFLRALSATGVLQGVVFDPALGGVKVVFDLSHPAAKFSWDGVTYIEVEPGFYFPALEPDHPAFSNCKKMQA